MKLAPKQNNLEGIKGKIKFKEPLSKHTTFKIGGPADFFVEPNNISDLKSLLVLSKEYRLPVLLIGAGSNLLINDSGLRAIVIKLNSPCFKKVYYSSRGLCAGSGLPLSRLVGLAAKNNLSGLEFLAGIPGTVGGALIMNAGSGGQNFGDLVKRVRVMDFKGNIKTFQKKEINFRYRKSGLEKFIILSAFIKLRKKGQEEIKGKIKKYIDYRKMTQDNAYPNAGCIFKNPHGESAGRLIDLCNLKGKKIGCAGVSLRHANFILNHGRAKASEVLTLMALIKKRVKQRFGLNLKPEIKIWD